MGESSTPTEGVTTTDRGRIELPASLDRLAGSLDDDQRRAVRDVLLDLSIALGDRTRAERDAAPSPRQAPLDGEARLAFYQSLGFSDAMSEVHDLLHAMLARLQGSVAGSGVVRAGPWTGTETGRDDHRPQLRLIVGGAQ